MKNLFGDNRQANILSVLRKNSALNIEMLAQGFGVSERTVRNDIKDINKMCIRDSYEITDKISCPVKWGGVLIIVKIIIKIDIQFFDILKLDVMINAVSNIHKNNNTDKCGAIKIKMYAGHKN